MARLSLVRDSAVRQWDVELWVAVDHPSVAPAVAAAIAIDLAFDLETVDDVRMATDEICSELSRRAVPATRMHCGFEAEHECLGVTLEVQVAERPWARDRLGADVVDVLADSTSHHWDVTDGRPSYVFSTSFRPDEPV